MFSTRPQSSYSSWNYLYGGFPMFNRFGDGSSSVPAVQQVCRNELPSPSLIQQCSRNEHTLVKRTSAPERTPGAISTGRHELPVPSRKRAASDESTIDEGTIVSEQTEARPKKRKLFTIDAILGKDTEKKDGSGDTGKEGKHIQRNISIDSGLGHDQSLSDGPNFTAKMEIKHRTPSSQPDMVPLKIRCNDWESNLHNINQEISTQAAKEAQQFQKYANIRKQAPYHPGLKFSGPVPDNGSIPPRIGPWMPVYAGYKENICPDERGVYNSPYGSQDLGFSPFSSESQSTRPRQESWEQEMLGIGNTKAKRSRISFTQTQLKRLEEEFQKRRYMVGTERLDFARELGLHESKVKVWFQNRRTKWRKEKSENTPGNAKMAGRRQYEKLAEAAVIRT